MKYILSPFFKYLWLGIKIVLQIILAILLTISWGIPTLIWNIIYFIFVSLWEFKLCFYNLNSFYVGTSDDSITCNILWSEKNNTYKSYFHCIFHIQSTKPIMVQIMQKLITN